MICYDSCKSICYDFYHLWLLFNYFIKRRTEPLIFIGYNHFYEKPMSLFQSICPYWKQSNCILKKKPLKLQRIKKKRYWNPYETRFFFSFVFLFYRTQNKKMGWFKPLYPHLKLPDCALKKKTLKLLHKTKKNVIKPL
jgi:hypothetical protein